MSIQSAIAAHMSGSGFYNRSMVIKNQCGDAEIPDGVHIRFYNCNIGHLYSANEKNVIYVNKGSVSKLEITAGEYHIIDANEILGIDVNNSRVFIENTPIKCTVKTRLGADLEIKNTSMTMTSGDQFDCEHSDIKLLSCNSDCLTGGVFSYCNVIADNFNISSVKDGVIFNVGTSATIADSWLASLEKEWAVLFKNGSFGYIERSKLSGYLYSLKVTDGSSVEGYRVQFTETDYKGRSHRYHYSVYLKDNAVVTLTGGVGSIFGTDLPAIELDNGCRMTASGYSEITGESDVTVKIKNNSTFECNNIDKCYCEDEDVFNVTDDSTLRVNNVNRIDCPQKDGIKLEKSVASISNIEGMLQPGPQAWSIKALNGSQVELDNWSGKIIGHIYSIGVVNSQAIIRDGKDIAALKYGIGGSEGRLIATNVSSVTGNLNGCYGSKLEVSMRDCTSIEGTEGAGIEIKEEGRLVVIRSDTIFGKQYGCDLENVDMSIGYVNEIIGEEEDGIKNIGTGEKNYTFVRNCFKVQGNKIALHFEKTTGDVMKSTFEGGEKDIDVKTCDLAFMEVEGIKQGYKSESSNNKHSKCKYKETSSTTTSLERFHEVEFEDDLIVTGSQIEFYQGKLDKALTCTDSEVELRSWEMNKTISMTNAVLVGRSSTINEPISGNGVIKLESCTTKDITLSGFIELKETTVEGNLSTTYLRASGGNITGGVSADSVHAIACDALSWDVVTGIWQNCNGNASCGSGLKLGGGLVLGGYSDNVVRVADGTMRDAAAWIHHDFRAD